MPVKPSAASRRATATRRNGQATAARIVHAARELLMNEGYAQFSMRNVALRAGVHLANVQYYFKTREELVRALLEDTGARYRASYDELNSRAPADRLARFQAVVDFNLKDIATRETRRYFIQLWALLATLDGDSGSLMNELYAIDIQQLSECIADLAPQVEPAEVRRRASLLAALIEGMVVVRSAHSESPAELKRLMARTRAAALQIGLGLAPELI